MKKGKVEPSKTRDFEALTEDKEDDPQPPEMVRLGVNETLEGLYMGCRSVKIRGRVRPTMIHRFLRDGEDTPVEMWGSAMIDRLLSPLPAPTVVRVTYQGKQEDKVLKTSKHVFSVLKAAPTGEDLKRFEAAEPF